jgi:hypothetical protein
MPCRAFAIAVMADSDSSQLPEVGIFNGELVAHTPMLAVSPPSNK